MKQQFGDFEKLLEERFTKEEIATIHRQAEFEALYLKQMKKIVHETIEKYLKKNNATIDDIVNELGWKKSKILNLQKGSYNLTVPELGYLLSRLENDPRKIFQMTH